MREGKPLTKVVNSAPSFAESSPVNRDMASKLSFGKPSQEISGNRQGSEHAVSLIRSLFAEESSSMFVVI